jgi:hypothetical protein
MSTPEPMRAPSVPTEQVKGPQDLVQLMNTATSEDYETVPLPARQQLGDHDAEPLQPPAIEGYELADFTGKRGEELMHSVELSEPNLDLSRSVTYHLEATEPPAEPAGAPGTSGYNKLNRHVAPAGGFEHPADYSLEQGAGVRTFRLPEGESLATEEQAQVDGVGPFPPAPILSSGDPKNISDDTRERSNQTPSVNDPYRQPDGSLRDPKEVQQAAPAHPEGEFGAKEVAIPDEVTEKAAVDVEGAKVKDGNDVADGPDQTTPAVGQDDTANKSEEQQEAEKPAKRGPGRPRKSPDA